MAAAIPTAGLDGLPPGCEDLRASQADGCAGKRLSLGRRAAVLYIWPWLGEEPAEVLAREIILFVSREYPEWFWH
jgi:hypothetical protein